MAGLKSITDEIAFSIAAHCPNIMQISFRNCDLTDLGVCQIAMHCPRLIMIALAGIHDLTDKCIIALADNCPYLDEVYLSGCAKITKQAVTYLVVRLLLPCTHYKCHVYKLAIKLIVIIFHSTCASRYLCMCSFNSMVNKIEIGKITSM